MKKVIVAVLLISLAGAAVMIMSSLAQKPVLFRQAPMAVHSVEKYMAAHVTAYRCPHVHLNQVLGLSDNILSNKRRFLNVKNRSGDLKIKLVQPFCGFQTARVDFEDIRHDSSGKSASVPRRLSNVQFRRVLGGVSSADVVAETQRLCDELSRILGIYGVRVVLREVTADNSTYFEPETMIGFDLAGRQQINVIANEAVYVSRDGVAKLISPASIEMVVIYNYGLNVREYERGCSCGYGARSTQNAKPMEADGEIYELAFGPDCSTQVADALSARVQRKAKQVKLKK